MEVVYCKSWKKIMGDRNLRGKEFVESILEDFLKKHSNLDVVLYIKLDSKSGSDDISSFICFNNGQKTTYVFSVGVNVLKYNSDDLLTFWGHEFCHVLFRDSLFKAKNKKNNKNLVLHILSEVRADLMGKNYSNMRGRKHSDKFILYFPFEVCFKGGYLSSIDRKEIMRKYSSYNKDVINYVFKLLNNDTYALNYSYSLFLEDIKKSLNRVKTVGKRNWILDLILEG